MKDDQHCYLLEKSKIKLQWDTTSHWSELPSSSKNLQTVNAGECEQEEEPSYPIGGNVN